MSFEYVPLDKAVILNPRLKIKKESIADFVEMADLRPEQRWVRPSIRKEVSGGSRFQAGDTLFARITPCLENGKIAQYRSETDEVAFGSTEFIVMRGREGVSINDYVTFLARSGEFRVKAESLMSGTSGRQRVNLEALANHEVLLPSLQVQQQVADLLNPLDEKIELNRQTARTLEELAQRLFKSWFVDFDPVRAKMAGRKPAHMPPEIAALFPDKLVDSPRGSIPEEWEVKPIEDIVTIKGGATPPTKQSEYWEGGTYHWATPKDLSGLEQKVLIDTDRKITSAGVEKISSGQLPAGTVLMSSRAPVGYLALADMPVSINQGFIAMICDRGVPNTYILHWAESSMDVIKSNAGGSTFAEISKKQFRPLEVVVPPVEILEVYDELASDWFDRISLLAHDNVILAKLRDRLLPKLISGEIRVPEAQEIAEEA